MQIMEATGGMMANKTTIPDFLINTVFDNGINEHSKTKGGEERIGKFHEDILPHHSRRKGKLLKVPVCLNDSCAEIADGKTRYPVGSLISAERLARDG